jgi:DNA-binding NtrC family response regulator
MESHLIIPLAEVERQAILKAIEATGTPVAAAKQLGIGKTTIYRKLAEYAEAPKGKPCKPS